jgi:hypothetical protein
MVVASLDIRISFSLEAPRRVRPIGEPAPARFTHADGDACPVLHPYR